MSQNALVGFGREYSWLSALFGSVLGGGLILGGIYILNEEPTIYDNTLEEVKKQKSSNQIFGWTLIISGIIIIVLGWVYYIIAKKNRGFAEVEGLVGGATLVDTVL